MEEKSSTARNFAQELQGTLKPDANQNYPMNLERAGRSEYEMLTQAWTLASY